MLASFQTQPRALPRLALALLGGITLALAGCRLNVQTGVASAVPDNPVPRGTPVTNLGSEEWPAYIYRFEDTEKGVVCYATKDSAPSCLKFAP